jgi:hypothetical protein
MISRWGKQVTEKAMKQMGLKAVVIGASTFARAALLSFGWS